MAFPYQHLDLGSVVGIWLGVRFTELNFRISVRAKSAGFKIQEVVRRARKSRWDLSQFQQGG